MRHSLPNARIMIHQPSGGAQGQATDIQIQAEEILKLKKQINGIYVKHTGQDLARIGTQATILLIVSYILTSTPTIIERVSCPFCNSKIRIT